MEAGHTVQIEDERTESRASSGTSQLAFIEYPAPPDSADGRLLLRQLSAKDRVHFPVIIYESLSMLIPLEHPQSTNVIHHRFQTTLDSPRSIVLPEPGSNNTSRRLTIPMSCTQD